ncbi:energy-coupling factor transporter transmembrane component T [Arthrobacter burdickii]|uniref:Energy-coupling factor transporter transmembrane component T n=1 Tax=Arthrobacter burdickii TaxID=3035920 RepID=A0ABT8K6Q9_9MICC|nr:energy-coupling factor transporter transmembrane component T [Arthrobacter burdickii]MDN4612197.1 energy-coupling factor transporter transmembrane component T [Arthrobacter burdickii]
MPRRRIYNPLTELLAAVLLVVLVLVVNRWAFSLAVLVFGVLPAVLLSGRARQIGLAIVLVAGPLLLSSLLLHGLFFPEGSTVLVDLDIARVTTEGLIFAAGMGLRMTVFTGVLLTAAMTLDIPELLATMTHRGWNRKLVFIVGSAVGLLPHVALRAQQVTRAQQARGLVVGRGSLSRFRALVAVTTPLVIGLLVDASERNSMLEARGFSSPGARTSYLPDTDTPHQRRARRAMVGVVGAFSVAWLVVAAIA